MSELKELFMQSMKQCVGKETRVALALSGGKDSTTILFALLEMGITPICYSLHVEGIDSSDYVTAKRNCESLGVEFHEVVIPKKIDVARLTELIVKHKRVNKVDVEVYLPLMYLLDEVKEKVLLVGITAGVMLPLSKKACIHFKNDPVALNKWRDKDWEFVTKKDFIDLNNFSDIIVRDPFYSEDILAWFKKQSWDTLHKPNQKQVLIDLFPEQYAKIKTLPQISMQVGDSGIREIYTPLLEDKSINLKNRNRVNELYKDIYAQHQQIEL